MSAEYRSIRKGAAAKGKRLTYALPRRAKKKEYLKFRREVREGAAKARRGNAT